MRPLVRWGALVGIFGLSLVAGDVVPSSTLDAATAAPVVTWRSTCRPTGCVVRVTVTTHRVGATAFVRLGRKRFFMKLKKSVTRRSFPVPPSTSGYASLRVSIDRRLVVASRVRAPLSAGTTTPPPVGTPTAFRALIIVPKGTTIPVDATIAVQHEVVEANKWFAQQTGGTLSPRWDGQAASGDMPSVTVVNSGHTVVEYNLAADPARMITQDIAIGAPRLGVTDVVWIDVQPRSFVCGQEGGAIAIWEAACEIYPSAASVWPNGGTYLLAHEMTHGFGAAEPCAPHYGDAGHVTDSPSDIIYSGPLARNWDSLTLDVGHDDYFSTGRAGCDISSSGLWWR